MSYTYVAKCLHPNLIVADEYERAIDEPTLEAVKRVCGTGWYLAEIIRTPVEPYYSISGAVRMIACGNPETVVVYMRGTYHSPEDILRDHGEDSILYGNAVQMGGAVQLPGGRWTGPPYKKEVIYL